MRTCTLLLACVALAGGCDDDTSAVSSADLSAPVEDLAVPADMTTRDLAMCLPWPRPDAFVPSTDAGAFCVGTSIAGTCAQAFFERIYDCFAPAGCCGSFAGISRGVHVEYAWASGAFVFDQRMASPVDNILYTGRSWSMCNDCGRVEFGAGGSGIDRWTLPDGTTMLVTPATGDVTCPDGSSANIGSGYEQCAAIADRLDVMHNGSATYANCSSLAWSGTVNRCQ